MQIICAPWVTKHILFFSYELVLCMIALVTHYWMLLGHVTFYVFTLRCCMFFFPPLPVSSSSYSSSSYCAFRQICLTICRLLLNKRWQSLHFSPDILLSSPSREMKTLASGIHIEEQITFYAMYHLVLYLFCLLPLSALLVFGLCLLETAWSLLCHPADLWVLCWWSLSVVLVFALLNPLCRTHTMKAKIIHGQT